MLTESGAPGSPGALSPLDTKGAVDSLIDYANTDHVRFGTGWSVDDTCGEVGTGEMALMWARSGSGKSTWYLNVIRNTPDVPTLVVNMEMTPRRQMEWLTAMTFDITTAGRDLEAVLRAGPQDDRYPEARGALEQMPDRYNHLYFVSPSRPTISDLGFLLDDIEDASGVRPQRVFVDHMGLMGGAETGYDGYVRTSSGLHSFAMKEDIAMYVLQQVGRSGGDQGRNDGHLPVTFSSGLYTGEQDADWVYGLYRPDRDPKFKRSKYQFDDPEDYYQMVDKYNAVRGHVIFQVIKNRPFSEVCEDGITLIYDPHTRRYREVGAIS